MPLSTLTSETLTLAESIGGECQDAGDSFRAMNGMSESPLAQVGIDPEHLEQAKTEGADRRC
jgi:hypothetical protein